MKGFNSEFKIIAEIGCNHEGSFEKAIELTQLAAEAGADIVKFQSYTPERFISNDQKERLNRVKQFALTKANFHSLYKIALDCGMQFMSTPVTEDWIDFLNPLVCAFKIASGDITFRPVIQNAAQTGKHIILSTGAAHLEEIDQAIDWIQHVIGQDNLQDRLTLMHCVSAYPTPLAEANILSIPFLRERYKVNVGYSNHVIGISASLAAVAQGAQCIEVHFTDQKEGRTFRDHSLSFDAEDLKNFKHLANEIRLSLGKFGKNIQNCERDNILSMRKGIIAAQDIKVGETLTKDHLMYSRPATEFAAIEITNLIGKQVNKTIQQGYIIPKDAIVCAE